MPSRLVPNAIPSKQTVPDVKSAKKEQKEKEPQKSNVSTLAAISVPVLPPAQVPDLRHLTFSGSTPKDLVVTGKNVFQQPAAKGYAKEPAANTDTADTEIDPDKAKGAGSRNASVQALQTSPLAFSVTLPKSQPAQVSPGESPAHEPAPVGKNTATQEQHSSDTSRQQGQQDTNTRESDQVVPSVKKTDSESILKTHATAALTNVVPAPGLAAVPQPEQAPYSNPSDLKALKSEPVAQTEKSAEPQLPTSMSRPQTIDLKIGSGDKGEVAVRVSQRAGDVQVTVRTADGDLAQSLKQHLPELSDRLVQNGVHGEIWQPVAAQASSRPGAASDSNSESSNGSDADPQGQRRDSNAPAEDQHQKSRNRPAAAWLDELTNA